MLYRHNLCDLASYRLVTATADSHFLLRSLTLQDIFEPAVSYLITGDDTQHADRFLSALSNMTSLESISLLFSKYPSWGLNEENVLSYESERTFDPRRLFYHLADQID